MSKLINTQDLVDAGVFASVAALHQARFRGRFDLPAIRIGSRLYWRQEDLDAWLESKREQPQPVAS